MRIFATPTRRRSLPLPLRVLMTFYLLTVLLGLGSSAAKYATRTGVAPASVVRYYAGDAAGEVEPPKSTRFLTDVTHPHLFSVPLVLLVVCHLVHMTGLPAAALVALDGATFLGFLATFGLPWLGADRPGLAPLLVASGTLFLLATALQTILALVFLWLPGRRL